MNANRMKILLRSIKKCLNYVFLLEQLENYQAYAKTVAWPSDVKEHARKRVERYCKLAIKKTEAVVQSFESLLR